MSTQTTPAKSGLVSSLYFTGMVLAFIGERLIGAGGSRTFFTGLGALLVVGALGARLRRRAAASEDVKSVESALAALYAAGALALVLYVATSDLWASVAGQALEKNWPRLAVSLSALWPALMAFALLPLLLAELSYSSMARAPRIEALRVRDAMLSGVGLAGAVVFAMSLTYVASERDKKADLSYFRTAKAGEATKKIVGALDQPVSVSIFFPPASDVRGEVLGYLDDLKKESKLLEVHSYDKDVDPAKAKELGVSGNGIIVVHRGQRREQMSIGVELEAARGTLRNLDKELQKRLILVGRTARTVYLVTGHNERSAFPSGDTDKRGTIKDLRELLSQQGYALKDLGAAEGLATDIPNDAAALVVVGPQKPFLPEEIQAIGRFWDRGGRLFIALDPENGQDFAPLLQPLGLSFSPVTLANDQVFARNSNQKSDRANLATGSYSSHPAVTVLGRYGMRAPVVLLGAGSLTPLKDKDKQITIDMPVRSLPSTWEDKNGNFEFDTGVEQRKQYDLEAAVQRKTNAQKPETDGRALVLADSDGLTDGIIGRPPNMQLVVDGMKWLMGDEAIAGEISSEQDVPITHTKKQDVAWFYGTIFLAPGLVLGLGWLTNRRRRGKKEAA